MCRLFESGQGHFKFSPYNNLKSATCGDFHANWL
jgi:hypothetical protein